MLDIVERALELAAAAGPKADAPAAMSELETLIREPDDFVVRAANLTKASIVWKQGATADADALMRKTLAEWLARQRAEARTPPVTDLERDVAAMRNIIFQPPDDGEKMAVSVVDPPPGFDNVVVATAEQVALLIGIGRLLDPIDPNASVAASSVSRWWNTFFQAGRGAWTWFHVETFPIIARIEFLDAARTRAVAGVHTSGSEGARVVLQKVDGAWRALRIVNRTIA